MKGFIILLFVLSLFVLTACSSDEFYITQAGNTSSSINGNYTGIGNAYACFNENGTLYRSNVTCI